MTTVIPIAEFEQQPNRALNRAVINREDVVVERQGRETAVIVSMRRYQELLEAEKERTRGRLKEALEDVYRVTSDIPAEEMEQMIQESIQASRQVRKLSDTRRT